MKQLKNTFCVACLSFLLLALSSSAITINVPSEQPTIQAGIDAASDDDTVMVAPGTYKGDGNRDIYIWDKEIVIMSSGGPEVTIIDCEGDSVDNSTLHRAFNFSSYGESFSLVISGFTIQNGVNVNGGAIASYEVNLTVDNCIFKNNRTVCKGFGTGCTGWGWSGPLGNGGAIAVIQASLVITNCKFIENFATTSGGGIYAWSGFLCDYSSQCPPAKATVLIDSCEFIGNYSGSEINSGEQAWYSGQGGGVYLDLYSTSLPGEDTKILNCIFRDNYSLGEGGAICNHSISFKLLNTVIDNNTALHDGGGAYFISDGNIDSCIFTNNIAGNRGGGAFSSSWDLLINDCLFAGNEAQSGGGLCFEHSDIIHITNCTIVDNYADTGSGINWATSLLGTQTIDQSIVAYNQGGEAPVTVIGSEITCTNIYGNESGDWVGDIADQLDSVGNFSADPLFCDPSAGDYKLSESSPCLPVNNDCGELIGALDIGCVQTGIDEYQTGLPLGFSLQQNYPNPFNPTTTIEYNLPSKSHVVINIFNIMGQKVRTLLDLDKPAGSYIVSWDGKDNFGEALSSGIYLYRIQSSDHEQTRKMLLLK